MAASLRPRDQPRTPSVACTERDAPDSRGPSDSRTQEAKCAAHMSARGRRSAPCPRLSVVVLHLSCCYLLEGDREVVFRARFYHRGRELIEGALAEVVVVAVDLPGALGCHDHPGVV